MGQHPASGIYWANSFDSPDPLATLNMDQWTCVEVMLKLNNPVSDSTGQLALWINGTKIAHYGKGFPNGTWNNNFFMEGAGPGFEGFRWRKNNNVKFNYIWLKNYSTGNVNAAPNDIYFDHVVVAKSYIGPISVPTGEKKQHTGAAELSLFPNPADQKIYLSEALSDFSLFNSYGELIKVNSIKTDHISVEELKDGIYFLRTNSFVTKFVVTH
jgi:hypothetical protein